MEHEDILHRCFRCGWCKLPTDFSDINCPPYLKHRFETYSPGGRLWLIRAWLEGEIELSDRLRDIVFSCATCRNCVEACALPGIKDFLVEIIVAARSKMVDFQKLPPTVSDYLTQILNRGNPFKKPQSERGSWAEGLGVPLFEDQEYLLYVGDAGSFDELGIQMSRNVASLLIRSGVSFGILARDELSDGNDVKALGETDLFDHLARENTRIFGDRGAGKVITLSPHAYNAFRNDYPETPSNFDVYHYTQVLAQSSDGVSPGALNAAVTYHDPCYLGRWNGEYQAPRHVLSTVQGLTTLEMDRHMGTALCCGGGGGNYFTDILGSGTESASRTRVREAVATGADILVVGCPICYKMLDDAVKDEGLHDRIRVMDVAETVLESVGTGAA